MQTQRRCQESVVDFLYSKYNKHCIKYWLKLLRSPQDSLPQTCYKMQTDSDAIYKRGWITNLKKFIFSSFVWITQGEQLFTKSVVLRLTDIENKFGIAKYIVVQNSQHIENLSLF